MKISLDTQKERILKKIFSDEELTSRVNGLLNEWASDVIANYYRNTKTMPEILNELDQ